jgi:hypothetical protein
LILLFSDWVFGRISAMPKGILENHKTSNKPAIKMAGYKINHAYGIDSLKSHRDGRYPLNHYLSKLIFEPKIGHA